MQFTETQAQIRDTARRFAEQEIAPHAAEWDRQAATPRALYRKMAATGLMGVTISPEFGGAGADFLSYVLAIEEIAAADGGISNVMAATNSPVSVAIEENGTDQQKRDYLTRLTSGEWLGCIHLTEPHAGSDAAAIRTRAERVGEDFNLNGEKAFITAGATADLAMIVAVTDPDAGKKGITTFITPTDNPGYRVIRKESKLGHRTNDTCQVRFQDMRVPGRDVLGAPGEGLRIALRVRPETLCRITEFSEHESNGRELDEGERVAVEVLPVLGQSAAAVEPGDGAFDRPKQSFRRPHRRRLAGDWRGPRRLEGRPRLCPISRDLRQTDHRTSGDRL